MRALCHTDTSSSSRPRLSPGHNCPRCIWPDFFSFYKRYAFIHKGAPSPIDVGCANVCSYLQIASLILRIQPRDIIYMNGIEMKGERGECEWRGRNGVWGRRRWWWCRCRRWWWRLPLLAAVTPGHDSRAPVFEYNALYCPRHIIYLPVK